MRFEVRPVTVGDLLVPHARRNETQDLDLPPCERSGESGGGLGRGGHRLRRLVEGSEQPLRVGACDATGGGVAEQGAHGLSFVNKGPHVALGLSQREGTPQRRESSGDGALRLVGERLQRQDLDQAARPLARFRRVAEALQ
jgi:hypothetical protein